MSLAAAKTGSRCLVVYRSWARLASRNANACAVVLVSMSGVKRGCGAESYEAPMT